MRLIDAYKLMMYLADIKFGEIPTGFEPLEERKIKRSICEGIQMAEEAVDAAPPIIGKRINIFDPSERERAWEIVLKEIDWGKEPWTE